MFKYTFITINIFYKTINTKKAKHYFCKEVNNLIKKSVGLLITAVMTMGLAACNNNGDNAALDNRTARVDRDNGVLNVGNGKDDGIDHNGPLTEDYSNNDNSDSDMDRGRNNVTNNRGADRIGYKVNNDRGVNRNADQNRLNVNNNRNANRNQSNIRTNENDMVGISADRTSLNSKQYPHTRAILIQEAKYKYIPFGSIQGRWYQYGAPQQGVAPNQQQQPTVKEPAQQPAAPAPPAAEAPAPTAPAPAPAAPKPQQPADTNKQTQNKAPATGEGSQFVQQVIDLTNGQRSKNGLPALKADTQLNGVAQKKSADMQQKNYFSHTSPTYGSPFDMMRDFGVTYKSAGENIAQGQRTPQEVVNAWMNSEGHRKNILSRDFTHIGVGYEKTGNHWTQMFIGK